MTRVSGALHRYHGKEHEKLHRILKNKSTFSMQTKSYRGQRWGSGHFSMQKMRISFVKVSTD